MTLPAHWDDRYENNPASKLSWYQERSPEVEFINEVVGKGTPIIDIGGGLSPFVDQLYHLEFTNLTVLDISGFVLAEGKKRIDGNQVEWICSDIRDWKPDRMYGLWHDRAVFHFLTQPDQVAAYVDLVGRSIAPGGHLVMATFADDGPTSCSGLPVARYSATALAAVFSDCFDLVTRSQEDHRTPTGATQPFSWVLLRRHLD